MSYEIIDDVKKYVQVNYTPRYYEELFTNLLEKAYDVGLISHNELFPSYVKSKQDISSYYVMTLSIIADSEEDIYYDMTDVYRSDKIEYAIGEDLDDIGLKVGCIRPPATYAGVELTFKTGNSYDKPIPLSKGINVSTSDGVTYTTMENVIIPIGEVETTVYAESIVAGVGGRVAAETLNNVDTTIELDTGESISLSCTNLDSSSGGREEYTDEEYRELILDWIKQNIKGSKEAYDYYFASFDGIDSYKLIPNWDGSGTLKIVLDPGYPFQLKKAYDDIFESVAQLPSDITMWKPEYVPISLYAYCNVDIDEINPYSSTEKEEIKSRIEEAINIYINGDVYNGSGLKIGEDFIPYKLGIYINKRVPELKNITFDYPTKPITITDEQIGYCNDITIVME